MDFMKKNDVEKKQENDKKDFLILELQRYHKENGKVPTQKNMQPKFSYPSSGVYQNHFGSWNNALEVAGLKVNQIQRKLDGTEICSRCGKRADEIFNHAGWRYHDGVRYCEKHGHGSRGKLSDYIKGELDINSPTGRGRAGEICVVKALKIGNEYDYNKLSCGYSFDMYNDEYGKIDVKTSVLSNKKNNWNFVFGAKKIADIYICLGMTLDTKNVEHVWVVPNVDGIRDLIGFTVHDTCGSLYNRRQWEVDVKPCDNAWQEMLDNYTNNGCKIFK